MAPTTTANAAATPLPPRSEREHLRDMRARLSAQRRALLDAGVPVSRIVYVVRNGKESDADDFDRMGQVYLHFTDALDMLRSVIGTSANLQLVHFDYYDTHALDTESLTFADDLTRLLEEVNHATAEELRATAAARTDIATPRTVFDQLRAMLVESSDLEEALARV